MKINVIVFISFLFPGAMAGAYELNHCQSLVDTNSRLEEKVDPDTYGWLHLTLGTTERIKAKFKPGTSDYIMKLSFDCAKASSHNQSSEILIANPKRHYISFSSTQGLVIELAANRHIELISIEREQIPDPSIGVGTK